MELNENNTVKNKRSEQSLVNEIIYLLKLKGHFVWRQNTGSMYSKDNRFIRFGFKGVSDILGISNDGKFIAIECKIKPNKPTQFQLDFLDEIRQRDGIAIVAYSIDDIQELI